MQYTEYFSFITKENGTPNIKNSQFRRMMNIVFIEGVIIGLNKVKETNKGNDQFYKYDVTIFNEEKRLSNLTGNLKPEDLIKEMLQFSD